LDVNFGTIKRMFTCAIIDRNDEYVYCGTTTGDVLEISIERAIFKRIGPYNKLFSKGVSAIG
jgi:cilia- and flagella-associated protein 52